MVVVYVALRKESVDRNALEGTGWTVETVALRKESVDRNLRPAARRQPDPGRSPQGERG